MFGDRRLQHFGSRRYIKKISLTQDSVKHLRFIQVWSLSVFIPRCTLFFILYNGTNNKSSLFKKMCRLIYKKKLRRSYCGGRRFGFWSRNRIKINRNWPDEENSENGNLMDQFHISLTRFDYARTEEEGRGGPRTTTGFRIPRTSVRAAAFN